MENYTYNIERVESLGQMRKEDTENLTLSGHTEGKSESSEWQACENGWQIRDARY